MSFRKWLRLAVLHGFPCFTPWLRPARPLGMWGTQHGYQTPLSWDWLAPCEASQGLAKRRRCVCFLEIDLVISGLMTTWFYCCIELPHFCCQMTCMFQPFFFVISCRDFTCCYSGLSTTMKLASSWPECVRCVFQSFCTRLRHYKSILILFLSEDFRSKTC